MSSAQRSSSGGIRDLRAMFEKSNSNGEASSSVRGRSPGGDRWPSRSPASQRVTSSFVNVNAGSETPQDEINGQYTAGNMSTVPDRRGSVSLNAVDDEGQLNDLKKTISQEQERRSSNPAITEVVPEEATVSSSNTPSKRSDSNTTGQTKTLPSRDRQSEHPDKVVSAVEDVNAALTPADPKSSDSKSATSQNKPSGSRTNSTTAKPRTSNVSDTVIAPIVNGTKSGNKSSTQPKGSTKTTKPLPTRLSTTSTASKPATTATNTTSTTMNKATDAKSPPSKMGPRSPTVPQVLPSHLTAQTASSFAKHEPDDKKSRTSTVRRSAELSSHLLAPTASSKAKHEDDQRPTQKKPAVKNPSARTSLAPRASLGPSTLRTDKPKPRSSLASSATAAKRSDPQTASKPTSKSTAPVSGSFMSRMMKPTTASASKHAPDTANTEVNPTSGAPNSRMARAGSVKKESAPKPAVNTRRGSRASLDSKTAKEHHKIPSDKKETTLKSSRISSSPTSKATKTKEGKAKETLGGFPAITDSPAPAAVNSEALAQDGSQDVKERQENAKTDSVAVLGSSELEQANIDQSPAAEAVTREQADPSVLAAESTDQSQFDRTEPDRSSNENIGPKQPLDINGRFEKKTPEKLTGKDATAEDTRVQASQAEKVELFEPESTTASSLDPQTKKDVPTAQSKNDQSVDVDIAKAKTDSATASKDPPSGSVSVPLEKLASSDSVASKSSDTKDAEVNVPSSEVTELAKSSTLPQNKPSATTDFPKVAAEPSAPQPQASKGSSPQEETTTRSTVAPTVENAVSQSAETSNTTPATLKKPKKKSKKAKTSQNANTEASKNGASSQGPAAVMPLTVEPLTATAIPTVPTISDGKSTPSTTAAGTTQQDKRSTEDVLPLTDNVDTTGADVTSKYNGASMAIGSGKVNDGKKVNDEDIMAETPRFGGAEIH